MADKSLCAICLGRTISFIIVWSYDVCLRYLIQTIKYTAFKSHLQFVQKPAEVF